MITKIAFTGALVGAICTCLFAVIGRGPVDGAGVATFVLLGVGIVSDVISEIL